MYNIDDYDYELPIGLIAQAPVLKRDESRLLSVNRSEEKIKMTCCNETID